MDIPLRRINPVFRLRRMGLGIAVIDLSPVAATTGHGLSRWLRGLLHRPKHFFPDSRDERWETGGYSVRAAAAGLPVRNFRKARAAGGVRQPAADGNHVRFLRGRGDALPDSLGINDPVR